MSGGKCRLCCFGRLDLVCQNKRRAFFICESCGLITVPQEYWLSVDDEKRRYSLHNNSISNDGYVKFLSCMVDEVQKLCVPGSGVLDFGSGEEAALCQLLSKKGINCYAYDPLFCKNLQDNGSGFDIIILCEVIEHIRDIRAELELINKHLSEDGKVILRTQTCGDITKFAGWWYAQDLTHINFFNQKSLKAAAGLLNKRLCRTEHSDIFVLR